jgi:UDP-N-acetylglucosamine 1-carboxyvinyltransferase
MSQETNQYIVRSSVLEGEIHLSGAKNSVLRLLAASILTKDSLQLDNFPSDMLDVLIHLDMLKALGKSCKISDSKIIISETSGLKNTLKWQGRTIRNTLLILGALTARFGEGSVPPPGGCQIGASGAGRTWDLHEMLLERLGARVWIDQEGMLCAELKKGTRLKGADIHLPIRSTGATENSIICGCLAEGVTRVWNPHIRPEIIDLIECLTAMGAKIKVFGQEHIEITGSESLTGCNHYVVPDNMEALTWLVGSVITNGDVEIHDFPFEHLEVPLIFLRESGARFFRGTNSLIVRGGKCYPIEISTGPYPGINSDMQPLFAAYGLMAAGKSHIIDLRFPGRYKYADELKKMGGTFSLDGNLLSIVGGKELHGAEVDAVDLRAGIALLLTGLTATGETVINQGWQIDRGYNCLFKKLKDLGGNIDRISS